MKLREIYARSRDAARPVFSFEFFPPKSAEAEASLFAEAERLKALGPAFFSMTYGAGGGTREKTVDLGARLRETVGVETVCHVTCVGQSRDEVRAVLEELRGRGLENVMALRGDPPPGVAAWTPHPRGFRHAFELVQEARALGDFSVAVAGFPEMHPESTSREDDLRYLAMKVDAGADAVVTQLFFDNEDFFRFERDARAAGVKVPIVPGILPPLSAKQVRRFAALCKARIPAALDDALSAAGDDEEACREVGIRHAAAQIAGLLERGAPGIHLYCLNRSGPATEIFRRVGIGR